MKLADIAPAPWNARYIITPDSVADLARSIDENGLISPLTLWKDADGYWLCIAGNRRLVALKSLHSKAYDGELPKDHYKVFGGDENEARAVTIAENLQREDLGIIEEAAAVTALLDLGATVKTVAAQIGKSEAWVSRRRKLATLTDEWKERAGEVDADALEKIATYPADVQKRVAKVTGTYQTNWANLASYFDRESKDLDAAKFDTAACAACAKRTGVEADLFGITDGDLGRCLDCKCFEKHRKAWEDAEIKRLVGDAEVVRVKYAWELPRESDGAKNKRDKKHPCAYVFTDSIGNIETRWGESAKAKKAREEAEAKASAAEREAKNADRERADEITDRLKAVCEIDGGEYKPEMIAMVAKVLAKDAPQPAAELVTSCVCDWLDGYHDWREWVEAIDAFPALLAAAGVSEDDAEWFRDYAERD